jgi:hypothetical protein
MDDFASVLRYAAVTFQRVDASVFVYGSCEDDVRSTAARQRYANPTTVPEDETMPNATDLLREDHRKVKDLFHQFEEADNAAERRRIADVVMRELEIHSIIEEEIFYPAVRRQDDTGDLMEDTMNEADEEHHVADLLMAELKKMRSADARFAAKFTVLAENVKHHIQEEESEIFTKAAEAGMERLQELGLQMEQRKLELMKGPGPGAKPRKASRTRATTRKPSRSRTMPASRKARTNRVARSKRATTAGAKRTARKASSSARKTVRKAGTRTKSAAKKATTRAAGRTRAARAR